MQRRNQINQDKREKSAAGNIADVIDDIDAGARVVRNPGPDYKKAERQEKAKQQTIGRYAEKRKQPGRIKTHRAAGDKNKIAQLPDSRDLQGGETTQNQGKPSQFDDRGSPKTAGDDPCQQSSQASQAQPVEENQSNDDFITLELG